MNSILKFLRNSRFLRFFKVRVCVCVCARTYMWIYDKLDHCHVGNFLNTRKDFISQKSKAVIVSNSSPTNGGNHPGWKAYSLVNLKKSSSGHGTWGTVGDKAYTLDWTQEEQVRFCIINGEISRSSFSHALI